MGHFVELFAVDNKLYRALDRAEARVRAFGGQMAKVGAAIAGAGALVRGPLEVAKKFAIDDGAAIDLLAKSLNTTAEDITAFGFAASKAGVPFEDLTGFLGGLNAKLTGLADGTDASADRLRDLGVYGRDLINLPFNEQMEKLAQAVRETVNPIDRATIATEMFGESGKAMLPVLEQGAAGMRKYMNEAKRTGQVMTGEQATKAAAAQRALTSAYESARKAVVEVGMAMIPSVEIIAKYSAYFQQGAAAVRGFIRDNATLVAGVGAAALGVVGLGTALVVTGGVVTGVASAFGALVGAVTTVIGLGASIVGALFTPLGLVAVAVAAAVAAVVIFTEAGQECAAAVGAAFGELATTFGGAWDAMVTALKAGDLEAAFAVVVTTVDVMLKRAVVKMLGAWNDFKGLFVDAWNDGLMLVRLGMESASTSIALVFVDLLQGIEKNFKESFGAIIDGAAKVAQALGASQLAADMQGLKGIADLGAADLKKIIEEDHNAANKKIFKDRGAQQDASDKSRGDDLQGAKSALEAAEAAFAKALTDAAEAGEKVTPGKKDGDWELSVGESKKKPAASSGELPSMSRGTFTSTSYGQAFAAPSIAGRQLREQEKANELLEDVVEAIKDGDKGGAKFK